MKKGLFEIVLVLDESGSMSSCKKATINGVNEFLKSQSRITGDALVTLVKFSGIYDVINDAVPLDQIDYLNSENYAPSNTTALLDAVGVTIELMVKRLTDLTEENTPEKVIFVIITDGYENASKEYSRRQIFSMVSHQKENYHWEFIFLGADINSWGREIGIQNNVNISKKDLRRSFKGITHHVVSSRLGNAQPISKSFNLTEDELDQRLESLFEDESE